LRCSWIESNAYGAIPEGDGALKDFIDFDVGFIASAEQDGPADSPCKGAGIGDLSAS
jgi:hypothetical protein